VWFIIGIVCVAVQRGRVGEMRFGAALTSLERFGAGRLGQRASTYGLVLMCRRPCRFSPTSSCCASIRDRLPLPFCERPLVLWRFPRDARSRNLSEDGLLVPTAPRPTVNSALARICPTPQPSCMRFFLDEWWFGKPPPSWNLAPIRLLPHCHCNEADCRRQGCGARPIERR
jgi:hypothetical protein